MGKGRLEAFTDGVIAVVITIIVLEMKVPDGFDFAALRSSLPIFLVYALSYANVGIFWNNHHHICTPPSASTAKCCGRTCSCCSGFRLCPL